MDNILKSLLSRGIAERVFRSVDLDTLTLAIQNAFSAFTYSALVERQIAGGDSERIEADIKALLDIMCSGIAA